MRFYLGTHQPSWLTRTPGIPLMLSHRRLAPMRRLPIAVTRWALDSGGFTELSLHGGWTTTPQAYGTAVRRYQQEIGNLDWAAPQDWMCEPHMLRSTGRSIADHQRLTVDNYLRLREENLPVIPVLQGWCLSEYLHCADLYDKAGVDLPSLPLVGLGSVCRRQHTPDITEIVTALSGLRLHGFGVKTSGLSRYGSALASADSMAWSLRGRYLPGCTAGHKSESNCLAYALAWRARLLATASGGDDR
ncbi:deazapurine DNA modification protein DpdA family protein [Nonomuraea endophytica]|uniref:deazapurine DNA modification protein DpdA family protein n=1 Tax=Nonomuraea endophytica TaxID=714136 RepID=UPI0037C69C1A